MENRRFTRTLIFVSLSACVALGSYFALTRRTSVADSRTLVQLPHEPTPSTTSNNQQQQEVSNKLRTVPEAFAHIDFENRSYGRYRLWAGKKIDLRLTGGKFEYDYQREESGWFDFKDVYYADVTGDGAPEAVVVLWHVGCGVSCDGGTALFYIYSVRKRKLHRIWKYETGSLAYGCGLKSFSVDNQQIVLEVFGRCAKEATENPGPRKFVIENLTRLVFRFNGRRVVRTGLKFLPAPATDVKNYEAKILINS